MAKTSLPKRSRTAAVASAHSLRELARNLGVHASTVADAVARGHLAACVVMVDGSPRIRDLDAAVREWHASRRPKVDRNAGGEVDGYKVARTRRELALAEIAEHQLAQLRDEFVPAEEARAYIVGKFTLVKTLLLGVPSKLKQRDRSFTTAQIALVDDTIREALNELADEQEEEADEEEDEPSAGDLTRKKNSDPRES
jgi:phage terminase Nu1 subunit (DNA packaging protein)